MDQGRQVFAADLLERYAAKGRGVITCMAAGNDVIVLGTSKGWVIRHDFGVGDSYDIDLSAGRPGEQSIHRVFVDPGGSHCIATIVGSGGADTFYTHAKWTKPRILSRLKGLVVNAVAWNRQQITEAATREVILGTDNGQLYEIAVDEKDKREKYIKPLFELAELPEAIMGLQMETAILNSGTRYYVMAVTPTRLYSFTGIGSLETVFASYLDRAVHFMELPGEIPNSELHFFIKQRRAVHFAWLSGAGIYHGGLNFGSQHSSPNGDENFVENKALLDYTKLSNGAEVVKPSSMAVSEFHFLLLIGNKVKVVNRISEQIIEELQFDQASDSSSRGIIGLCSDATAGLFYAYDQNSIFQVSVNDEGRDMWKVYLDLKEYAAALANSRDPLQRDQVYLVQAEAAFTSRDFLRAASFYAKINYILSFEEITLKFISVSEQDALRTFLLRKLDNLAKDDKCQITMISTWATELYLDKINRLLLEDDTALENRNSEYQSIIKEFRAFLSDCKDVLDEVTTMRLLESYGRVEELVYFAGLKGQYEIVVHYYIQQGEAKKALEVLRKPAVPIDLQYKFAPDLVTLDAYETVESWMASNNLNPRDDTTNEVEEYASVSTVCLKEVDSNRQIEKSKSEVEEHLTKDREASVVIKESEEMRQDEESGDRVSMQGEEKESEEKIDDIVDGSKLCQDKSDIEAVTKVRAETSLNNTEVDKKLVSTSNISSETTESDANLETKELKLEEISSDLAPSVPTNDNDEVERQRLNVDIVDKDEAEVIKKDPDAVYLSEDQIDETEKSLKVEKVDQLSNNDHVLVETKSEASKTSNADELGKIELASDGGHFSEDNGFEQDAETKKSLTVEELEANEVEETKGEPETSSNYLPQKVETILEEDAISSHNTLTEEKLEEQLQTSTSTLPSEDEEIKTPNSTTKIEEEIQKDAGTVKHESLEDSSDTKTKEEVCLQKEEQRKPQAVSGEETVVNQGLQKEEPEKQVQTTSSTFPSQEMENAAGAISDEIDVVTGDGITGEHTLSANKPEEGTTSFASLSKEQEEETVSTVEKIDKKKINEAEIPGNKISEDSSDAKKTAEMCMEKEEFQGLEDATNDETAAQTIQVEEPKEQSLTSAMPSENIEHGTTANEEEEEKVKGVEMLVKEINLEKEKPEEPEAVVDQETTVGQASITEESVKIETIGTIEKLDEDNEMKEAENLEDKICEDSSSSLQKEEPNELHTVPKERITSGQTFSEEQPDEQLHISTSAITSEEQEHETKKTEDKETNHEATVKDGISEDASDARTTEETCSQKERSIELAVEDAMTAGHTVTEKKSEEQAQNPTSTLPSKEVEGGNTSTTEKIESKKIEEAEFLQDDIGGDVSLQKERFQEDEALAKDENASSQTLLIEEQISNLVATLPLEEHKHETVNEVDKTEEEKVKEKEMQHEDSDVAKKVVEICSEKYETRGAQAALEGETIASQVITQESEEKKPEEAETLKDDKSLQTECVSQGALEDGATAAHTLSGENQPDQLHSTISTLPSEEQKDETKETELLQDESPEKITKQTREIEEASNVKMETPEKAIDNELLTESEDAARDETAGEENQCEKTNEGNEVILTEVSKEEVIEDKEVIETSYSTSHSGKLTKDGSAEDEPRDKLIEDLTNEALETTCQNEELLVEAQKSTENDTIEKQIVCENKTVEDPGQASVSGIEAKTVTEEASSIELSLAEGNQIIDDIQQPGERTNMASDKQIPKELDPIENTEITSSFGKEHAPIDLQERVAEPSRKAEVGDVKEIYPKQAEVDHGGETITDNSGEDITKESTTKVSSSNHIESSTKETLQVTQDTIEEREAKDENGAAQILSVEKPEEQSPAPSSKKPSDGASPQVEAVEEKEVEILYKDSSDTKTGEEICLAKDENKKVKTVVEQETIAVKAPPSEIKEDPVSPFEDGRKENELKDEDTLKVQTYEIQNEELCVETLKDGANDNIEKEIVAEDETVKEATTVREEIPGEAYLIDSGTTASLINKEHFPTEQQDRALVTSDKAEAGDMEPGNAQEICSEVVVDHGDEQKKDNLGVQITQEPASVDSAKPSLSGLHQRSTREKMQVSQDMIEERELRVSKEEPHVEEAKTEEKDGEEGDDHNKRDSGSDAPVMVEAPRDTDTKPHKKSQNILSGVGLKVKHSISKVKKAITGKSSHSKESKPISPKGSEK